MVAKVNTEECTGCGICAEECPANAITLEKEKAKVDANECTDCSSCAESCPNDAITIG
jgi:ferredoxin